MIEIPDRLDRWRETAGGAAWLDRLPAIVAELADRWSLATGEPFGDGNVSLAVPVTRGDGTSAVLKVNFPERETEHEADALAFWDGIGAARLLERADDAGALLVERLEPGTQLWAVHDEDEANEIAAGVLLTLRRDVPESTPFYSLADEALRRCLARDRPEAARRRSCLRRCVAAPRPTLAPHRARICPEDPTATRPAGRGAGAGP